MLTHPILEKLRAMRLWGMAKTMEEQMATPEANSLSFEERFGLMVDREMIERENRRLATRLKKAKLRLAACMEDIDYRQKRGMDKAFIMSLASCAWVRDHHNVIITGPTGVGKTYLACALAHKACLEGYPALYRRLPHLLRELAMARGDGRYPKVMAAYAKADLLVLDDWGLDKLNQEQRLDLLELLEDRYGLKSTIVTAQVPVEQWHEVIGDPTLADAILDRLVHNAYRIQLKGESMRKKYGTLT
jgi:DNA replication protein DnaC